MKLSIRAVLLSTMAGAALVASLGEAHALEIAGGAVNPDGSLTIVFWDNTVPESNPVRYTLSATGTAVFVCGRHHGISVFTDMRVAVPLHVSKTDTIDSNSAGEVEGIIKTDPLGVPPLECPTGYEPRIAAVNYASLSLGSRYGTKIVSGLSWNPIPLD